MAGETWPPTINSTEAHQSITNLSASNFSDPVSMSDYPDIQNFTNMSLTNSSRSADAFFSPFDATWLPIYGYYIYFIIMTVVTLVVLFKTRDLGSASVALLLMCAMCATNAELYASPVLTTFQAFIALGLLGALVSLFAKS